MPTGDPPGNWTANNPYSHIYIGDPLPTEPDSAGNNPFQWIGNQPAVVPSVWPAEQLPSPFTITFVDPKDGDLRWNIALDAAEIFDGKSKQWIQVLTAEMLKQIYGEVKQAISQKSSFDERFRDIICEAEGISSEESDEERKKKEYLDEMVRRVKVMVLSALEAWAEQQAKLNQAPPLIYTSNHITYGNST